MASKSVKRARVDASSSKDSNAINSPPMTAVGGAEHEDVVSRLRTELEVATKCIEQLRREKDYEVRQVREEEQNRSSTAMKELESRLKTDCHREIERAREAVKSRLEADTARLVGRYERTVKRLSNDLDRCRNELREEIEKRGMSSTTRGGFEAERCRLLAEVRDLKAAKRRLEETTESAAEVNKQKTAELKRTQEACKAEVAKVSKEANAEIRRLLEELKAKDHQLALLDRNQYPDRGASLTKHQTVENPSKETEPLTSKPVKPAAAGEVVDKRTNDSNSEAITDLKKVVEKLRTELAASEADRTSMNARLDELHLELTQRNETISTLKKQISEQNTKQSCFAAKTQPKAVRFLLPGLTSPVLAREVDLTAAVDDDNDSISSEMSCSSLSSATSPILSPDTTVLYDENIEKNYHLLLTEHLNLQRSVAQLLSSCISSASASASPASATTLSTPASQSTSEVADVNKQQSTCIRQDCIVEKDSLRVALDALKQKHTQYEQNVCQLQQQLAEQREQNEDLEFRLFELEECAEKCKLTHTASAAEDLLEKTHGLENEMSIMKGRLAYYKSVEDEMGLCDGLGLRECVALVKSQLNDAENQSAMSRLEVLALRKQLEEITKCQMEVSTGKTKELTVTSLEAEAANTGAMMPDVDELSMCAMNCSMSTTTTSGFDDDNSCASSVADLRLEEMPSEETWGFDEEEVCIEHSIGSAEQLSASKNVVHDSLFNIEKQSEPQYAAKLAETQQQRRTSLEMSPADTVWKSDDEIWLARIEKLEVRLAQAMINEQRARDQAALLGEEKDRRIAALQEQVDVLEANEFRLSETIRSLERLERTFSLHLKTSSENGMNSTSSSPSVSNSTTSVATMSSCDDAQSDKSVSSIVHSPAQPDDPIFSYDDANGVAELTRVYADVAAENRLRYEASEMLRESLKKLRQAESESETIDKRIREIGDSICGRTANDELGCCTASEVKTNNDWNVSSEIVDFESEYRELEILIKELKKVLIGENENCRRIAVLDTVQQYRDADTHIADHAETEAVDDACCGWATGSVSYSLPASPVFDIDSHMTSLMMDRSKEFQLTERHLTQQIRGLEQDRDALREAVSEGDAALRELGIQLVELQSSEQSLKDEVSRLRAKEDWMISRNNELMELVGRLEESVKSYRTTETELRSRCERHCAGETELGRQLDDVREELHAVETRYRRWVAQLDDEKLQLQSVVDELMEKNSDLEGREAGLLCRIRKLEAAEFGLRSEVADLERSLSEALDDRDKLLMQVNGKEDTENMSPSVVVSVDFSTQCDDVETECEERCRQLGDRAEFFKEMLEFTEQSYAALESRLVESTATEATLRATLAEYEKIDKIWADRSVTMEADNERMAKRIAELEVAVEDVKAQYHKANDDHIGYKRYYDEHHTNDPGLVSDKDLMQVRQDATTAFRGIMLLSNVADELDDSEMIYWAAVESTPTVGHTINENDLTSPIWTDVEARMGLTSDSVPRKSDDGKRTHQLSLTLAPVPSHSPDKSRRTQDHIHRQPSPLLPPPLPLSPPPASPDRDRRYSDSFPDRHRANGVQPRSQSVDFFASRTVEPSGESRGRRASSENRDTEIKTKLSVFIDKGDTGGTFSGERKTNQSFEEPGQRLSSTPSAAAAATAVRDPVMERISKSREFWSARSLSTPGQQTPDPHAGHHGNASNGRPSLIPRIAPSLRTPPLQRSVSEYDGPKAGTLSGASVAMPVIRSTPSPHLSPRISETESDDKKNNKSYIPRPIGDHRVRGSDSDSSDHASETKPTVTHGRPGHRDSSKIYTTVLGPNRYVTSKFSYLSGSPQTAHAARTNVTDSKMNLASPSSSSAMAANQLSRPVVSSTATSSEVAQLPSSRA